MVTRNDVARLAKVSSAVVSYVLNNTNYVSKDTREAVLKAVDELNYIPNRTARSLKKNKTYQIAVLRGSALNDMFNDLLYKMEGLAYEQGYIVSLITVMVDENLFAREQFIDDLIGRRFDAIFVANSSLVESQINRLVSFGIATLLYTTRDYLDLDKRVRCLAPNYRKGVRELIELLIDNGHSRIAFVPNTAYPDVVKYSNHRFSGYIDALEARGIPINNDYICQETDSIEEMMDSVATLFDPKRNIVPPTAIYADESVVAGSIIKRLQDMGKRVPEDISIVSSSDSTISRILTPRLTAVGIPPSLLASKAIEMMLDLMGGRYPESCMMEMTLFNRESIRPLP